MKQALIYIGMLLLAISCGQNRDRLHTGDLLFQAGKNTEMTGAITAATGEEGPLNFSHVGSPSQATGRIRCSKPRPTAASGSRYWRNFSDAPQKSAAGRQ